MVRLSCRIGYAIMLANRMKMAASAKEFVFTITTAGEDDSFTLPLEAGGTYDFTITWGDGSSSAITVWNHADVTHTYEDSGASTYTIRIRGTITGWRFNNAGDKTLIRDIKAWGALNLGDNNGYFYGCSNLTVSATDILDISQLTTLKHAFWQATSLTTIPSIDNWDTSNVINMNAVFQAIPSFNQDLSGWDTSSVTNMAGAFFDTTSFDQDLSSWDITSLTNATDMFKNITLSTANYDALLIGWEGQVQKPNVTFHGGNSTYTGGGAAEAARDALVADGWTITDGGQA